MESVDIRVVSVTVLVGAIVAIVLAKTVFSRDDNIPSVGGGLPFFGHVFTMIKGSPWDTMDKWVKDHGTFFKFHLFGTDALCVADPALLKIILQTRLSAFKKDTDWTYKPFMVLLGNGLVTAEGNSWRTQRTLLATHLKIDILEEVPAMSLAAVSRLCLKLDKARAAGVAVDMAEEFRHMTLQVIAEALLSLPPEESDETFAHMYLPIVEEGNLRTWHPERMYLPTPAWFKFRRDVQRLNAYVEGLIDKRRALRASEAGGTVRKQDVLDKLLSSVPEAEWGAAAMTQIRDGIKTFVLAGHETSASMLSWTLYELSLPANEDKRALLLGEAEKVFQGHRCAKYGHVTSAPSRERLEGLQYSESCLRESLRKYSVVPTVVRVALQDVELGQWTVKKGSTLMINIQGVHHNPKFWPEPFTYQPARFMAGPEAIAPYTFLPFIEGPRMCLGQYLSLLESKIVLSTLLLRYRFEVARPEEAAQTHAYMVPIIPRAGHFMYVK